MATSPFVWRGDDGRTAGSKGPEPTPARYFAGDGKSGNSGGFTCAAGLRCGGVGERQAMWLAFAAAAATTPLGLGAGEGAAGGLAGAAGAAEAAGGAGAAAAAAGAGAAGAGTPSQPCTPVSGVKKLSRQQYSLVPFFHTVPSVPRQLSTSWAKAPLTMATEANRAATRFSLFI